MYMIASVVTEVTAGQTNIIRTFISMVSTKQSNKQDRGQGCWVIWQGGSAFNLT